MTEDGSPAFGIAQDKRPGTAGGLGGNNIPAPMRADPRYRPLGKQSRIMTLLL